MSVQMVIELREKRGAEPILQAIESYKARLRASAEVCPAPTLAQVVDEVI